MRSVFSLSLFSAGDIQSPEDGVSKVNSVRGKHEAVVRQFVEDHDALFLIHSPDRSFLSILHQLFTKVYGFAADRIRTFDSFESLITDLKTASADHRLVLFIEHSIDNPADMSFTRFLRITYPEVLIIFVTEEVGDDQVAYLYEQGIDNCITKPIALETLIEKIANTVEPPDEIGRLMEEGKQCLRDGRVEEALAIGDQVLALKQGSAAGLMLKGDALVRLGRRKEALKAFSSAMRSAKLYLEPVKKLAELHGQEGNLEKQLHYLEKLNAMSPLNLERKVAIGRLQVKLGRADTASKVFDEAVVRSKSSADTLMVEIRSKIVSMCLEEAPALAERYLRQNLESQRESRSKALIETYNTLGLALRRQGKWREAIQEYEKALAIAPGNASLLYNLAMACKEGKSFAAAAEALDRALASSATFGEGNEVICSNMGLIYSKAGQRQKAVVQLERTLKINPGHTKARALLARLHKG